MPSENIPRAEWPWFCEGFGRQHAGWQTALEIEPPGRNQGGLRVSGALMRELHYLGADNEIVARVDRENAAPLTHVLHHPMRIVLETDTAGAHTALHIECENGERLSLRFPVTLPMEMLNGVGQENES